MSALWIPSELNTCVVHLTCTHLSFAERSYLLCAGCLVLPQPDAGTHLLTQPLIFHSHDLGYNRGRQGKKKDVAFACLESMSLTSAALQWR